MLYLQGRNKKHMHAASMILEVVAHSISKNGGESMAAVINSVFSVGS